MNLRDAFPWALVSGMKKVRGVPTVNANSEFAPDDGGLKRGRLQRESLKLFSKKSYTPFKDPLPIARPPYFFGRDTISI